MKTAVLLLGGNLGNTRRIFESAIRLLRAKLGPEKARSSLYRSRAWGYRSEHDFFNQLVLFETEVGADELLAVCLETENELGRKRPAGEGYADRLIDIDVLYLGTMVIDRPGLAVPHPGIKERMFALLPLVEVLPDFIHPVLKMSHKSLVSLCSDKTPVEKLD